VPATSACLPRLLFLLQPLTVLMKQTRQVVHAIKQSILLRCLCSKVFATLRLAFLVMATLGDVTQIGLALFMSMDKTKHWLSFKPTCMHVIPWINFSKQDKTWAVFSILDVAICMFSNFGIISKTAQLKVENSAQTTSRFSPVSYCAPQ
jgi:hypothetical protein